MAPEYIKADVACDRRKRGLKIFKRQSSNIFARHMSDKRLCKGGNIMQILVLNLFCVILLAHIVVHIQVCH